MHIAAIMDRSQQSLAYRSFDPALRSRPLFPPPKNALSNQLQFARSDNPASGLIEMWLSPWKLWLQSLEMFNQMFNGSEEERVELAKAYETLGLSPGCDNEALKIRYRSLMLQTHPDQNPGDKDAETLNKAINDAYDTIRLARNLKTKVQ